MIIVQAPEIDLPDKLLATMGGTFEAHITVDALDTVQRERFRLLCGELAVKPVLIELPEGVTRSQPMTASYHRGDLRTVGEDVAALGRAIQQAGFAIRRLKLEAVATNDGLPETDEDALRFPDNYFEFHAKLLLPAGTDLRALESVCAKHDARLSSNAFKRSPQGHVERFVTQRVYGAGRQSAFATFDRLVDDLTAAGHVVVNKLKEYAIYDNAVGLDAGWIDVPAGGKS